MKLIGYTWPYGSGKVDLSETQVSVEDANHIASQVTKRRGSLSKVATKYKLPVSTIHRWVKKHRNGLDNCTKRGPKSIIGHIERAEVKNAIRIAARSSKAVPTTQLNTLLHEAARKTAARTGHPYKGSFSTRFVNRFKNDNEIGHKIAQLKSNARQEAEQDPLNALSLITLFQTALNYVKSAALFLNYDATQFELLPGGKARDKKTALIIKDEPLDKPLSKAHEKGESALAYYLKWFCIISVAGFIAPNLVFLASDPNLSEDDFYFYKVEGMSTSSAAGCTHGFLCFTKTRNGNAKFFEWFNISILIPFIEFVQNCYGERGENTFVCCDGEAPQIAPYLSTDGIRQKLAELNVMVGKLAASTTAVAQACDCWKLFVIIHKYFAEYSDAAAREQVTLMQNIKAAIENHEKTVKHTLKRDDKARLVLALLKGVYAVSHGARVDLIKKSWSTCGITSQFSLNIPQILVQHNLCGYEKYTNDELLNIVANLPSASTMFKLKGTLTDKQLMNYYELCKRLGSNKCRDARVIHQQRCVLLNHEMIVQKELDKVKAKEESEAAAEAKKVQREAKRKRKLEESAIPKRKYNKRKDFTIMESNDI